MECRWYPSFILSRGKVSSLLTPRLSLSLSVFLKLVEFRVDRGLGSTKGQGTVVYISESLNRFSR